MNGVTERIYSDATAVPTEALNVNENSVANTIVLSAIPFSPDAGVDVNLATLFHQIDPAHSSGGRFSVEQTGVDGLGNPVFALVVGSNDGAALDHELQDAFQIVDNQYQVVINTYSDDPLVGGDLIARRQFTIALNNTSDAPGEEAPTNIVWSGVRIGSEVLPSDSANTVIANLSTIDASVGDTHTYALLAGSSAGFAISSAGVVTATAAMSDNSTYVLNIEFDRLLRTTFVEAFTIRTGANGVPNIIGGVVVDDVMYGLASNDNLTGGFGDDTLYGQEGDDTLNGGVGDDGIFGGVGIDDIQGGSGNDTIHYFIGDGSDIIDGGSDFDTLAIRGENPAAEVLNLVLDGTSLTVVNGSSLTSIESVTADLAGVGDELRYTTTDDIIVDFSAGTATGFASIASIERVRAGSGNDTLTANTLSNLLMGGVGNDRLVAVVDDVADIFNGNGGVDTLDYSAYTTDLTYVVSSVAGAVFGSGLVNDVVSGIENFIGGSGNDTITGNNIANILIGGDGNDTISGLIGNDTLDGGSGNDILLGGWYSDILTGGADVDTFDYNFTTDSLAGSARDVITDFLGDLINLTDVDANTTVLGNQDFDFIGTASFSDLTAGGILSAGQVRYFHDAGDTIIQVNTNNTLSTAEMEIRLQGLHTLATSDFVL